MKNRGSRKDGERGERDGDEKRLLGLQRMCGGESREGKVCARLTALTVFGASLAVALNKPQSPPAHPQDLNPSAPFAAKQNTHLIYLIVRARGDVK